ncbi:hypothetical protein DDE82_001199 [Stemphylium lycopersici]|nr:hypothetical protein TW65_06217 [Stemphylium lycopersici]RAR10390.1 hypothetical protein DDE82_001199 [Stemphylium lycopersici]
MVARLSLLSVFVTLVAVATSQQCYGVDGSALDNTHTPCNPSATHSACCASGDICMSNGLCMGTKDDSIGKIFSRGCTDATGKDVACASICPTIANNFQDHDSTPSWQIQTCDSGDKCCQSASSTKSCCGGPTAHQIPTPIRASLQLKSLASTTNYSTAKTSEMANHQIAIVGGLLGGLLGGIIIGLTATVWWMYKRERRQRRLKEHYETQMAKSSAYRKALAACMESAARPSLSVEEIGRKSEMV